MSLFAINTLTVFGAYLIAGVRDGSIWRRPLSEMITNFQGLAAYYPFYVNANDISGNAHHGTPFGITLTSDRFGNNTSAYRFSGAGSSVTTSWTGILGTQPRSVSMWVKKETAAPGYTAEFHGGGGGTTSHGSSWLCTVFQDTSLQVQIKTSDGSIAYAPIVDDDRWHHYVWVLPDTSLPRLQHFRVYQDGVQLVNTISSVNDTALINTLSGGPVGFGQYNACNGSIDAVRVYNVSLTHSEIQQLYHEGGYSISQYSFNDSWNLVSVPCTVADTRDSILFPSATSSAYAFTPGGYAIRDTLDNGKGYWVRFPASQTVGFAGVPRSIDSITVHTGWNMIGTVSNPILVTSVQQIPPTTIASEFYRYSGSYSVADTLLPSKGYWVKARSNGTLILSSALSRLTKQRLGRSAVLENASGIVLKDSNHESQTLYVTSEPMEERELEYFELPPPAPAGILDARFISNRILEAVKDGELKMAAIRVSSAEYPLTISWDLKGQSLTASLMVGTREVEMRGNGEIKVVDPNAALALKIGGQSMVPKEYSLHQNYPNPFNPATTIKYDLPVDSRVTLKIFSILGEEVGTLLDEIQAAGYKSLEWNSLNNFGFSVASGVYFYRIEAASLNDKGKSFMQMKKMLLLK